MSVCSFLNCFLLYWRGNETEPKFDVDGNGSVKDDNVNIEIDGSVSITSTENIIDEVSDLATTTSPEVDTTTLAAEDAATTSEAKKGEQKSSKKDKNKKKKKDKTKSKHAKKVKGKGHSSKTKSHKTVKNKEGNIIEVGVKENKATTSTDPEENTKLLEEKENTGKNSKSSKNDKNKKEKKKNKEVPESSAIKSDENEEEAEVTGEDDSNDDFLFPKNLTLIDIDNFEITLNYDICDAEEIGEISS